jgi:hypothetical protein
MGKVRTIAASVALVFGLGLSLAAAGTASAATTGRANIWHGLFAKGAVEETVTGGDWFVLFRLGRFGSYVAVLDPVEAFTFKGSMCAGKFTDQTLGGTTWYAVGPQTSYSGSGADNYPYYAYAIHESSTSSADYSQVHVGITSRSEAQSDCANPVTSLSNPGFKVAQGLVSFK